ncbi:GntR family transcriptional regulator [Microbacterium sp.]|uniref:GntR family transcriptional regulator n=1 Tax=Microbacterium sp. TaxID=51671 RepID=UPI002810A4A4|nr:GntR family transcriptional regulator [Microbacterium sp.]
MAGQSEVTRPPRRIHFDEVFRAIPATSRAPRYVQVIDQLENAIRRGIVIPGDTLPTEQQFCEGFGVARSTLRRAMDDLEQRRIVSRVQGSGTRVEQSPAIGYRPETSHTIFQAIALSHRQPRSVVTEFEPVIADDQVAALTGFPVGTPLLRIVRERYANDTPIAGLETYLLPEALCFERRDLTTNSLDALLHENGWTMDRVEYDISAQSLGQELAEFMRLPAGTPVLQEVRRGFHGERLFSAGRNTYHPVNHRLYGVVDHHDPSPPG